MRKSENRIRMDYQSHNKWTTKKIKQAFVEWYQMNLFSNWHKNGWLLSQIILKYPSSSTMQNCQLSDSELLFVYRK